MAAALSVSLADFALAQYSSPPTLPQPQYTPPSSNYPPTTYPVPPPATGSSPDPFDIPDGAVPLRRPNNVGSTEVAVKPADTPDDAQTKAALQAAVALAQKYTFLQNLQRSPANILHLKAERAAATKTTTTKTTPAKKAPDKVADEKATKDKKAKADADKQFGDDVVAGDWNAIHAHLAALPKDDGPKVYSLLLSPIVTMAKI